jgi:Protein of unknown function (DUF1559)
MSRKTVYTLLFVGTLGCCGCQCLMPLSIAPFEVPFYLLMGWAFSAPRLIDESTVSWPTVGIGASILVLMLLVLHIGLCRFHSARHPEQPWLWRWSLGLTGSLLMAFLAGATAYGICQQAIQSANYQERWFASGRQAVAIVQSTNNLKQIALGAHSYHDANKHLPAGGTFDADGRGMHSWQTMLLPYVDQGLLFQQINLNQPWNAPQNAWQMRERVYCYNSALIEQREEGGYSLSHYSGNVFVLGPTPISMRDITDGTSTTMMMGEVAHKFKPWGRPDNWRDPSLGLNQSPDGFGSLNPKKVVLFAMADGTVRQIREDVSHEILKALSTPRGGEKVHLDD